MSLERKLPVLMSGVLLVILAVSLALTYTTLARAAVETANQRLRRAARQLAAVGVTNIRQSRARYLAVANDSAVRGALAAASRSRDAGRRLEPKITSRATAALDRLVT